MTRTLIPIILAFAVGVVFGLYADHADVDMSGTTAAGYVDVYTSGGTVPCECGGTP